MEALPGGVIRVTLPMPSKPGHVHSYLLPGAEGWMVVDTGLGLPDAQERWSDILDQLEQPVASIFITHFHPDHVGAAADLAQLTGAPVYEGVLDFEQCKRSWLSPERQDVMWEWLHDNGVPMSKRRRSARSARCTSAWPGMRPNLCSWRRAIISTAGSSWPLPGTPTGNSCC